MEHKRGEQCPFESGTFQINYTVDSFNNGIAFGQHRLDAEMDVRELYSLRVSEGSDLVRLRSRYALHKDTPFQKLERYLTRLSKMGILRQSSVYFGVSTDPFLPFEGKFDASMKFLEIFQKYTPGMLTIQTRSPLVVIALPVLKRLGKHVSVTFGLETPLEEANRRYTPGLPRVEERLKTVSALRRFGIDLTLQVSPVLPYGDWKTDAGNFAKLLVDHSDHIFVRSITDGSQRSERQVKNTPLAQKLAIDRQFYFLRPDSGEPLIRAIERFAPEKLAVPERSHLKERQMKMFAA